ncbi:DUF4265 domain-containing protein [Pseudomonas purpurea]|uniref:DUF4265 domain-containing protein n=1 Tax=Pseudomonas purpurea TaxID=3136737 RepID=UPI0032636BD5
MGNEYQEVVIKVVAGENSRGLVYEPLHARRIDDDVYQLLYSPGLTLNLAKGDIISIKNKEAPAEVLKRGGNFCIHIYADHLDQEHITALEADVVTELDGMLDGRYKGNLTLSVPAKNGMDKIAEFFGRFRETTGIEWYYANIYKNLDDEDDETLLNWWLDS